MIVATSNLRIAIWRDISTCEGIMFRATRWSVSLMTVVTTLSAAVSSAEIVTTSFDEDMVALDLTAAGTKDSAVLGVVGGPPSRTVR